MNKYSIDYAIVSNLAACEFGHGLAKIEKNLQKSQIDLNRETVEFVKKYPERIRGLFWIKPYYEGCSPDGINTYSKYQDMIDFIKNNLSEEEADNIFYHNAHFIFNLN